MTLTQALCSKTANSGDFESKIAEIYSIKLHVFTPSPIFWICCHVSLQITKETEQAFAATSSEYLQECNE